MKDVSLTMHTGIATQLGLFWGLLVCQPGLFITVEPRWSLCAHRLAAGYFSRASRSNCLAAERGSASLTTEAPKLNQPGMYGGLG